MKTVIVYNHPYKKSFNHAILERIVSTVQSTGNEVDVIDLDEDQFNPVMSTEDLAAFVNQKPVDQASIGYIKRLKEADHLVFVFPIWWELMPAMMKGFIDKVIFPGGTYEYAKNGIKMYSQLPKLQSATIVTMMNTPKPFYKVVYSNAIQRAMVRGTLKLSGMKNVKWISMNMVKMASDKKRQKWLDKLETFFLKQNE